MTYNSIYTGAQVDDAVDKRHAQNTDTALDTGGANQITAAEIKAVEALSHTQGTDQGLDTGGPNAITAAVLAELANAERRDQFYDTILRPAGLTIAPDVLYWPSPYRAARQDATIARPGTGTRFNSQGVLETIPANIIRRDYDPVGGFRGALAEPQRTNLLLLSNADTLSTQSVTVTAEQHTLSFYGTGEVVLSGAHVATLTGTGALNRVTLTFTPTAGSLTLTVTGTARWPNLEVGAFASSHIPTEATTVTRPADTLTIPQVGDRRRGFICWQGVMEFDPGVGSGGLDQIRIFPFGQTNLQQGIYLASATNLLGRSPSSTSFFTSLNDISSFQNRLVRAAYWWDSDANVFGVSVDGVSGVNSATTFTAPANNPIRFGQTVSARQGSSHTDWIYISYQIPPIAQIEALTAGVL